MSFPPLVTARASHGHPSTIRRYRSNLHICGCATAPLNRRASMDPYANNDGPLWLSLWNLSCTLMRLAVFIRDDFQAQFKDNWNRYFDHQELCQSTLSHQRYLPYMPGRRSHQQMGQRSSNQRIMVHHQSQTSDDCAISSRNQVPFVSDTHPGAANYV